MYAIVDIETTGGYASANGITEIAVYVHNGERVTRHFETLLNPGQQIPPYITALTGISNEMVADAPCFDEVAGTLYDILEGNVFIAHNVNFDYSFVKHQLSLAGYQLRARKLCTVRLGRKVFPGLPSYSLGKLCRTLQINIENRHRAGGDAAATVRLFEHLLTHGAQPHIEQMLKRSSGEGWLPLHISKAEIDRLPTGPGIYYFYNNKEKVIYVGKAINIRKRVSSHFTQNDTQSKRQNLLRQVARISFSSCASELEALVLESTEIRRLWPKYNQSQKQPVQRYGLYRFEDNRGYLRLAIDRKKKNVPALYQFNLLVEGLTMLKKMIGEFDLNDKLCFVDKAPISRKDLDSMGSITDYNKKVSSALKALDEQLPSFALIDNGLNGQEYLCLLMERGCFWGMGYIPGTLQPKNAAELKSLLTPYADNDFIRNSIYSYAAAHPHKKIDLRQ